MAIRRFPRLKVNGVPGSLTLARDGELLNISGAGIGVRAPTPLRIGKRLSFHFGRSPSVLAMSGVVRWCRLSGKRSLPNGQSEPVYEAGIAFDDEVSERVATILEFMGPSSLVAAERRFRGRFTPDAPSAVAVTTELPLNVRLISMSGLLAETDEELTSETRVQVAVNLGEALFRSPARVAFAEERLDGTRRTVAVGLEFVGTSVNEISTLRDFITANVDFDMNDLTNPNQA